LGGWITDNWNWRWNFYINVRIGVSPSRWSSPSCTIRRHAASRARKARSITSVSCAGVSLGVLQIVLDRGSGPMVQCTLDRVRDRAVGPSFIGLLSGSWHFSTPILDRISSCGSRCALAVTITFSRDPFRHHTP